MMKETYITPVMDVVELENDAILTSQGTTCISVCPGDGATAQCDCAGHKIISATSEYVIPSSSFSHCGSDMGGTGCGLDGGTGTACGADIPCTAFVVPINP
ncbi:MAG: hypothetical protein J5546_12360 [Lachnospiraceae bacterium]|nr:hypothetical protein [Lachnospiraceae bacterium]